MKYLFRYSVFLLALVGSAFVVPFLFDDIPSRITYAQQPNIAPCNEIQVVFGVDQSGSMSGANGVANDPEGIRFRVPRLHI